MGIERKTRTFLIVASLTFLCSSILFVLTATIDYSNNDIYSTIFSSSNYITGHLISTSPYNPQTNYNSPLRISALPTISNMVLNTTNVSMNDTSQNLTLYFDASDTDGDSIFNITNWYNNGTSITILNIPFEKINGTTSSNTWDYSGHSNNGSEVGGILWNATGGYNGKGAYEFDGIDDQLTFPVSVASLDELTFSCWIRPLELPFPINEQQIIIAHDIGPGRAAALSIRDTSGTMFVAFSPNASDTPNEVTSMIGNWIAGEWHNVVGVFSLVTNNISLYLDGNLNASTLNSSFTFDDAPGSVTVGLSGPSKFNGTIDDCTIYSRALSPEQILALYNNRTDLIVFNETTIGDNWSACVTPNDGTEDGSQVCSSNVTILNAQPSISNIVLNTTNVSTNDTSQNLTLYFDASDTDGDSIFNITNWLVDDKSITLLNMPFEKINSTTTNNAWDYSGYGNNGSEQGGVVWNSTGGRDGRGAYSFDGSNDYISVPNGVAVNIYTPFTVSLWTKNDVNPSNFDMILSTVSTTGWADGYGMYYSGSSEVRFFVDAYSSNFVAATLTATKWNHLVGKWDGNKIYFYLNGILQGTDTFAGPMDIKNTDLEISRGASNSYNIDGHIDDLMIFNRSLSDDQIYALYNNQSNIIVSQETTIGENWTACTTPNDEGEDGVQLCPSGLITLTNPAIVNTIVLNTTDVTTNLTTENLTLYVDVTNPKDLPIKNITTWNVNGSPLTLFHMPFEKINGSSVNNIRDYSNFGNNGKITNEILGNATWNGTGGFDGGGAYSFDGVNDYISVPNGAATNLTTPFTISFWTKNDVTPSGNDFILSTVSSTAWADGYGFYYTGSNTVRFFVDTYTANFAQATLTTTDWNHIVGRWNGSHIEIFVNGVNGSLDTFAGPMDITNTDLELSHGASKAYNIDGHIDDIIIWNMSLSDNQIVSLYKNRTDVIVSNETTIGDNWSACVTPNDGTEDGAQVCSSNVTILASNSLPSAPILLSPADNSSITNRTPTLIWNNSVDTDPISYHVIIDDNNAFNNPEVNVSSITEGTTNTSYDVATELTVDTLYFWKVRANDSSGYGAFSEVFNFTLDSYLNLIVQNDNVSFGDVLTKDVFNTTTNNPRPFWVENAGNVFVNITINASPFFTSVGYPTANYQFRIEVNETNAYNTTNSTSNWTNMTNTSSRIDVYDLDWHNFQNDFLTGIRVEVPALEPHGLKSSVVTFTTD
jgi:hypothetical protein